VRVHFGNMAALTISDADGKRWSLVLLPSRRLWRWGIGRERVLVHGEVRTFGLGPLAVWLSKP
jgi:hypothetical protein